MEKSDIRYQAYVSILEEELKPAMGCTEPIAIAYCAAVAREVLGGLPEKVKVGASGSMIKNVKSVIVPNTDHLKGIPAAAAAGIVAGDPKKELEVIASVTKEQITAMKEFLQTTPVEVEHIDNGITFDIIVTLTRGTDTSMVRIANYHTNVVHIEKNGEVIRDIPVNGEEEEGLTDRSLLDMNGNDVRTRARAMAAAGSDARMNGCELPVIINSGSGNQGITASVPVIVYATELGVDEDTMYRAMALSDLTTIHQKTPIGRLSAYCGAVSAGAGSGAGIAYLSGASYDEVVHTVINAVAIISGMVCDGAKASCAAKIAEAVDAGIIGYYMAKRGQNFDDGDGIVTAGIEATIRNVGRLAKEGMKETNDEIISIMIGS